MDSNIPLTTLPGLSWPTIIDNIHGESGGAWEEVDFFVAQAQSLLKTSAKNISILEAGFAIGNDLVEFSRRGCEVKGVVYNPEFLDDVATRCIQNHCDVRLYLCSDRDIRRIRNIQLVIVPGTTFFQIAQNRSKAQDLLSFWYSVLANRAVIIVEIGALPSQLERPYPFTNIDGSLSTVTQNIQSFDTGAVYVKETLTYEVVSDTERIAVQNVRTFRIWNYVELVRVFRLNGFTDVRFDNAHGKQYIVACKDGFLSQRKDLWQTKN